MWLMNCPKQNAEVVALAQQVNKSGVFAIIKKDYFPFVLALIPISLFYFTFGCPIKFFTGISCLGCGMSRAAFSLLQFDICQAVHYHPLIFLMPVTAVVLFIRKRLPKRACSIIFVVIATMFVGVYVYRMLFLNGDVVCFAPEEGFMYKVFKFITGSSGI